MGHLTCGHMESPGLALTPRPQSPVGHVQVNPMFARQAAAPLGAASGHPQGTVLAL